NSAGGSLIVVSAATARDYFPSTSVHSRAPLRVASPILASVKITPSARYSMPSGLEVFSGAPLFWSLSIANSPGVTSSSGGRLFVFAMRWRSSPPPTLQYTSVGSKSAGSEPSLIVSGSEGNSSLPSGSEVSSCAGDSSSAEGSSSAGVDSSSTAGAVGDWSVTGGVDCSSLGAGSLQAAVRVSRRIAIGVIIFVFTRKFSHLRPARARRGKCGLRYTRNPLPGRGSSVGHDEHRLNAC